MCIIVPPLYDHCRSPRGLLARTWSVGAFKTQRGGSEDNPIAMVRVCCWCRHVHIRNRCFSAFERAHLQGSHTGLWPLKDFATGALEHRRRVTSRLAPRLVGMYYSEGWQSIRYDAWVCREVACGHSLLERPHDGAQRR